VQRLRVLIADDQEVVRRALSELVASVDDLELVGAVEDADSAVALAECEQPDVAVLDVKMPGGGARAAQGIRECSPATQVVALSAYEDRSSVLDMVRAGAIGYLVKGTSADEIVATIQRSARGESALFVQAAGNVVHALAESLDAHAASDGERRDALHRIRATIDARSVRFAFQPIFDLEAREPVGYEALARFEDAAVRPPNAWFSEADRLGLQLDLELMVVGEALRHVQELPAGTFLSLNLSPAVLTSPRMVDLISTAPTDRIMVELTEHAAIESYDAVNLALLELRALGIRCAVDDAGAGFASLRHILRLSPDVIKLDGSIIRDLETSRGARAMATGLISFADEMGHTILAEGVETERTVEILTELDIRYGQGFHLAPPATRLS
jgi:EAL domain-containing protein (putative c-di-GMP-specific phosphodiesterase class I)/DNA-binding NarL/FixJ family response regulator